MESLLSEEEVQSCLTRITTTKSHNFRYDLWMSFKCLQEFPEDVFLGVAMESLLYEEEV
jgi:hypothetical protein